MLPDLLSLLLAFLPLTLQAPLIGRGFSNGPVIASNFPDPAFIQVGDTFTAFATNDGTYNIPVATSPDFTTWTLADQDALPTLPAWSVPGRTWAPDVIQISDGSFVMYFAATDASSPNRHCIGVATASAVKGPYTPSAMPLVCPVDQGGAIDPSGFKDANGHLYVVYKIDGNSLGGDGPCGNADGSHSTPIMLQALLANGVTLMGDPIQILDRGVADGPLIEAPDLILVDTMYFLFFSSNCFQGPYYDISYATASAIGGPYVKSSTPLLITGGNGGALNSPGGACVGPEGQQMIFHSDSEPNDASMRQMWTAAITISGTNVSISSSDKKVHVVRTGIIQHMT